MTKKERIQCRNELLEEIFGKDNHNSCAYGYYCSKCKRDIPIAKHFTVEKVKGESLTRPPSDSLGKAIIERLKISKDLSSVGLSQYF